AGQVVAAGVPGDGKEDGRVQRGGDHRYPLAVGARVGGRFEPERGPKDSDHRRCTPIARSPFTWRYTSSRLGIEVRTDDTPASTSRRNTAAAAPSSVVSARIPPSGRRVTDPTPGIVATSAASV